MVMEAQKQQLTLAEFHEFCDLPENQDRLFELIHGEIVEKMASYTPSKIAIRIGRYLDIYGEESGLGTVTGADGGYILSDVDEFMPDVGYISKARMPETPSRQVLVAPDLAVEVKSPTDSKRKMRKKAEDYLAFGTKLVWLVFPDEQLVEVYSPDQEDVIIVGIDGVLDGGDVLPGFTLPVAKIFA